MAAAFIGALASPRAAEAAEAPTPRTDIFFLEAMSADRAVTLYEKVLGIGPETRVMKGKDPRTVVARDMPDRLARYRVMLLVLDTPTTRRLKIYVRPMAHRTPSEVAGLILETLSEKQRRDLTLVPDDRSGRLVVRTHAVFYQRLDRLIRRLDVPLPRDPKKAP